MTAINRNTCHCCRDGDRLARREVLARQVAEINALSRQYAAEAGLTATVPAELASPWILHLQLPERYQGAVVSRILLENYGLAVASSSACAAESPEPSAALLALGCTRRQAYAGLRISFLPEHTARNAAFLFESLKSALQNY